MRTKLTALSFVLAVIAAIYELVYPIYSGVKGSEPFRATLIQVNGIWAVAPVTFSVLVAAVALVFRKQAVLVVAAILMGGFSLVAMSVRLLYLPAAIVMLLAACLSDSTRLRDTAQ